LEAAIAAPSIHNTQPWAFAVGPRQVELYVDAQRHLRVADASGRSLLISCGAALFNLRVAADHLGFHPRIRLLPSDDPTLVAVIDVDHRHGRPGLLDELYPAIKRRRTNRFPFLNRSVPPSTLSRLVEAVGYENSVLRVYDQPDEVGRIVDLLHDAEFEESAGQQKAMQERRAWVGTDARDEGIPVSSLGPLPVQTDAAFRDLAKDRLPARAVAQFESAPTVAVLSTIQDRPVDWVRAGQALERLLLVATNESLAASFMNQPLEQSDLRWLVRSPQTGLGHSQMLLRIGYGVPVPMTPRRPLSDVRRSLRTTVRG
jgi:nitroreductase